MRTRSRRLSTPDPHWICPTRYSSENGPDRAFLRAPPEFRQKPERSGVGPERALEANTLNPLAQSAKANPFQSLLSDRRPDAA